MAELALEDSEWMLDLGSHLCDGPVDLLIQLTTFGALRITPQKASPFFVKAAFRMWPAAAIDKEMIGRNLDEGVARPQ